MLSKIKYSSWDLHSYDKQKLLEMQLLAFTESISFTQGLSPKEIKELVDKILNISSISSQLKLEMLDKLTCEMRTFQAGLAVLCDIDATYEKYPASAKEMAEVYLSCARIGRRIDKQVGAKYFAKAVECTKGLDYESYRKIYLYRELADKMSKNNRSSSVLSHKVIRLSEDFCRKLGDTKNFPYQEALSSATLLCEKNIWGALCRLDDRDDHEGFSLSRTIPIVLGTLLETNRISAEKAIALMALLLPDLSFHYNDLVDVILIKLPQITPEKQKPILEILIHDVLYNIPMDEKQFRSRCIMKYLESTVTSPELSIVKIKAMSNFLQHMGTQSHSNDSSDIKLESKTNMKQHLESSGSTDLQNKVNIKQYLDESCITSGRALGERLKELNNIDREAFVKGWLKQLLPDEYVQALTFILELLSSDYYSFDTTKMLRIIAGFVESVKVWPQVDEWCNDSETQKLFLQAFSRKILYLHEPDNIFEEMLRIFPSCAATQHEAFLRYVSNHIQLSDDKLVKALCKMSMVLSVKEANEFLSWASDIEMAEIHPGSGDSADYKPELSQDDSLDSCIANFIWRLLGHKDKGVRCKASHVILRSGFAGSLKIVEQISILYQQPLSQNFVDKRNYFFIESARLWYLATCLRIGKHNPKLLIPLFDFFKSIAYAEGVVHALHRRIAKNICLQIAPYCDSQEIERLTFCDQCMFSDSHTEKMSQYQRKSKTPPKWKFDFDTMDTLSYWYDDLAELFACTEEDIATECDYFIAQFGITNETAGEWSKQYLLNEDYYRTSNDHGLIPTVETLEKYGEWHSMFYVADKYRQTKEQVQDEYLSYDNWLNSYLPGQSGFWCNEFRNHLPFIPFLWNHVKLVENEPECRYFIPKDLAKSLLEHDLGISLSMDYHAHFQQSNQFIRVRSAFVKKEDIDKLVSEMKNPYTSLPHFYCEPEEYEEFEQPEPVIYSTYDSITTFSENALDKKDLLLKDYLDSSNYLMGISDELAKFFSLTKEDQILRSRVCEADTIPVQTYHWSEPENESGYEKSSTYGHLVVIDKECFRDILTKRNQAIVFEISISFKDDSYNFYGNPSKPVEEKKLFSLEVDGGSNMMVWKQLLIVAK